MTYGDIIYCIHGSTTMNRDKESDEAGGRCLIDNDDIITYIIYIQGMLIKYQTMRGGKVMLQDITKPTVMEWNTPMEAMMTVFNMEKEVSSEHILSCRS